jgi:hypothetical protein
MNFNARSVMTIRKLRIAWSVGCAVACALLVALWVRSGGWLDDIVMRFHDNFYVQIGSSLGTCGIVVSTGELSGTPWKLYSTAIDDPRLMYASYVAPFGSPVWGEFTHKFANFGGTLHGSIGAPYWLWALLAVRSAAIPWIRWRFTLRTLLIGTKLVAAALGGIVYSVG